MEKVLRREVREEVGVEIKNIEYVTSCATVHDDSNPSLVVSCMADYASGKLKLQDDENDRFGWVTLKEARNYQLIDGIFEELVMVDKKLKGKKTEWKRLENFN